MRRTADETTMSFLCCGCLGSISVTVPTSNDIVKDLENASKLVQSLFGWTLKDEGYQRLYKCPKCLRNSV